MVAGSTSNITNLTREDVVDYYNNNYFPANMVTVITGDVNPDEVYPQFLKALTDAGIDAIIAEFNTQAASFK